VKGKPKAGGVKGEKCRKDKLTGSVGTFPGLPAVLSAAESPGMLIAWTTVASREDAEKLASETVEAGQAVCVQIDGPVTSIYRWRGKLERKEEYRLLFKVLPERVEALSRLVHERHPYEVPEWVVVAAESVGEKYLSWAKSNSS